MGYLAMSDVESLTRALHVGSGRSGPDPRRLQANEFDANKKLATDAQATIDASVRAVQSVQDLLRPQAEGALKAFVAAHVHTDDATDAQRELTQAWRSFKAFADPVLEKGDRYERALERGLALEGKSADAHSLLRVAAGLARELLAETTTLPEELEARQGDVETKVETLTQALGAARGPGAGAALLPAFPSPGSVLGPEAAPSALPTRSSARTALRVGVGVGALGALVYAFVRARRARRAFAGGSPWGT